MMRLFAALCAIVMASGTASADSPWQRKPKPGAYTRWALPAAGISQSGAPEIIFTFDDGPHVTHTPAILDELKERGIKAIFFWVGWRMTKESPRRAGRRALVQRALAEGHVIANHTWDHEHLCKLKGEAAAKQIDDTSRVYQQLTGMPIYFFRAPYGDHCNRLVHILEQRGIEHLHWDIDPMEWKDHDGVRAAGTLRRKISKVGRLNRRAVIIMHDTRKASVVALRIALDWLDREQERRAKRGLPPIKILSGSDLATELADAATAAWLRDTAAAAGSGLSQRLSRLVP